MKTSTKSSTSVSASSATRLPSRRFGLFLRLSGLVEEAAALQQCGALLRRDLDVARGEQEDLVGDTLHAAVEGVGEAAREVDQPLRELGVRALQVEDHRDALLVLVGDLLCVVEAAREDEVHLDAARIRHGFDARDPLGRLTHARLALPDGGHAGCLRVRLRLGPVVEVLPTPARRQPADVRALPVALLEAL